MPPKVSMFKTLFASCCMLKRKKSKPTGRRCIELRSLCGWINWCAGCDHLRQVFVTQMGLSDKDIVALSGAHTLVCVQFYSYSHLMSGIQSVLTSYHNCDLKLKDAGWFYVCREGATRSALDLKDPGPPTLWSLITATSSEFCVLLLIHSLIVLAFA